MGVTSLSSFGAGAVPAVNSFALCVVQMRGLGRAERNGKGEGEEDGGGAGRVFGALALIQAVGQQILGVRIFPYFSLENHSLLRILTPSLILFFFVAHDIRCHLLHLRRLIPQSDIHNRSLYTLHFHHSSCLSSTWCFSQSA